jgi:hypothetical protein
LKALRRFSRCPAEEDKVTDTTTISRNGTLLEAEVDGEIVALNVESGTCYGFNSTATRVWSMIEQPRTIGEICATLVAQFDVEPDDCRRDVVDLLRELQADGLVKSDPPLAA